MKTFQKFSLFAFFLALPLASFAGNHQVGIGAHYWQTLDSIDVDEIDEDGLAWILTYQYRPSIFGLGIDLETKDKGFAGIDETIIEPQIYAIVGNDLYAAAGIGGYYFDGEFAEDPFYFFRAGFEINLIPGIHLDIHAIYRFEEWTDFDSAVDGIDTDTLSLGAAARIEF